jgi:hypothetical protein
MQKVGFSNYFSIFNHFWLKKAPILPISEGVFIYTEKMVRIKNNRRYEKYADFINGRCNCYGNRMAVGAVHTIRQNHNCSG